MAAKRKRELHETGDAKMKMAALKSVRAVKKQDAVEAMPSPAKALQDQLEAHYQPLHKRMSVILVSLLVAFAFVGGWIGGAGGILAA
ncbi:MAG: hypothetical protein AAFY82_09150 [Pseudomonadota bacterium]